MEAEFVRYTVTAGIAVITLDRPRAANAQNPQVLQELDAAWTASDLDRDVRVVVLRSEGKHFSAGHDMQGGGDPALGPQRVDGALTVDTYFDWEERGYLHYARRWRDLVKPSVAAVQGKCIAAGLMLCWPCDLIIAADNAQFSDPVGLMGMPGIEFFAHPWEFGPRRAKQILFTASSLTAEQAHECGMVNEVVPLDELERRTMELAATVASMDPWAVRLAKRAVNGAVDAMGFSNSIAANFDIHHLGHARAIAHTAGQTSVMADLAAMKARTHSAVLTYEHEGLLLHYDSVGAGPPVLCIHGATGTGPYEWSALVDALRARFRFVVPDLRGHGASDHRAGAMGIEFVNGDLLALIDHERLGRPHVVAFSFGAEAALDLELTHPGTCRSLVLLSPGLGDPKSSVPTRAQLEAGWPRTLRQLHTERHGEEHWLDIMVELCDRAAQRPKADIDALAAIACPILLLAGSNDDPRRIRQARVMEDAHPGCQLVVIEGARHAVHKDRPAEVAAAVGQFLDAVS